MWEMDVGDVDDARDARGGHGVGCFGCVDFDAGDDVGFEFGNKAGYACGIEILCHTVL
jgi:hypothetical protein